METNVSSPMVEISKGYTYLRSANMNGACIIRCFVRTLACMHGFMRIDVTFPQNGIFEVSKVWIENTELSYDGLPVCGLMCERTNKGITFWGNVPRMTGGQYNKYIDQLVDQLDVWVEFMGTRGLGSTYRSSVCVVEFRSYDFKRGQECLIFSATDHFTLKSLAEHATGPRAFTNYALVLPGEAEDYVNSDLLGRDDYDPTAYIGKTGSLYSFVFEVGC